MLFDFHLTALNANQMMRIEKTYDIFQSIDGIHRFHSSVAVKLRQNTHKQTHSKKNTIKSLNVFGMQKKGIPQKFVCVQLNIHIEK